MYNSIITLFSWKKPKPVILKEPLKRFTILIPCHNEEEVIQGNIEAILNQSYPRELYNIYVVADNCTDKTSEICQNLNIETIEVSGGSKPKALNLAIEYLKNNNLWTDDGIILLDADNQASPNMFASFNSLMQDGKPILQCRIASKNDDTIISKGFTSAFSHMNLGFQWARNNIGLSGSLSGTGFCVDRLVWDEVDFSQCHSLTEDLEFSIHAILKGYKITFIPTEYVLNQNLDDFKASIKQRLRWNRGHVTVMIKLTPKLFKRLIRKPSFQIVDSIIFLCCPSKYILYMLVLLLQLLKVGFYSRIPAILIYITYIYNVIFVVRCNRFKPIYIIAQIFYGACMTFIIVYALFTYKQTKWVKTTHRYVIKEHSECL